MNSLFIVLAVILLSNGRLDNIADVLKKIDFASFKPIFSLLGVNEKTTEFICSEKFQEILDGGFNLKNAPEIVSAFKGAFVKSETEEKRADGEAEKPLGLNPIKDVASSEIEESLGSFFS